MIIHLQTQLILICWREHEKWNHVKGFFLPSQSNNLNHSLTFRWEHENINDRMNMLPNGWLFDWAHNLVIHPSSEASRCYLKYVLATKDTCSICLGSKWVRIWEKQLQQQLFDKVSSAKLLVVCGQCSSFGQSYRKYHSFSPSTDLSVPISLPFP